jgi:hypothetical protein
MLHLRLKLLEEHCFRLLKRVNSYQLAWRVDKQQAPTSDGAGVTDNGALDVFAVADDGRTAFFMPFLFCSKTS